MLIQFNFKNFKSFKEEVSLDLSSTKITEHNDHVVNIGNEKILKVAAIYGANASGKSNIYEAFEFMSYYVTDSFKFGGDNFSKKSREISPIRVKPFLFDSKSKNKESSFEVFFIDNNDMKEKTYQYGFTLNQDEVLEEWLFHKTKSAKEYKTIFYRKKGQEIDLSGISSKSSENIKIALEKETLIVSLGSKLKISKLKIIRDWFINNEFINYGNPKENLLRSIIIPEDFLDYQVQSQVLKYFNSFDESIKKFSVEEINSDNDKEDTMYKIESYHKMIDSDGFESIPLSDESSGTLKMFSLYPSIQDVLKAGGVFFVDELNSRLHPLLVRNIILTFLNPDINHNNAQLIFTTHDIWQLSNDLLRRDEIWFVDKDVNGISSLYSLVDFTDDDGLKIRKDENYSKNYLTGKYGAIPKLKTLFTFMEE